MERTYHQCFYLLDGEYGYLLLYDGGEDRDGVFVDSDGRMPSFRTKAAVIEFALRRGLRMIHGDAELHHLDSLESWLSRPHPHTLDRNEALIAWNLFRDVAESTNGAGIAFLEKDTGLFSIYDKLFWSFSTPPEWMREDEPYDPEFSPKELQTLTELLTIGFRLFRQVRITMH